MLCFFAALATFSVPLAERFLVGDALEEGPSLDLSANTVGSSGLLRSMGLVLTAAAAAAASSSATSKAPLLLVPCPLLSAPLLEQEGPLLWRTASHPGDAMTA